MQKRNSRAVKTKEQTGPSEYKLVFNTVNGPTEYTCPSLSTYLAGKKRFLPTLYRLSVMKRNGEDISLEYSQFLDDFYAADNTKRARMIRRPPKDTILEWTVPILAATAHKLANDCGIEPPKWVWEDRCYLPKHLPYFACFMKGPLRKNLMQQSPPEFRCRNIYVSANALERW
jgi:hypothetical protein